MATSATVSLAQVSAFIVLALAFFFLVIHAALARARETGATVDARSRIGIVIQSLGIAAAGAGFIRIRTAVPTGAELAQTAAVVILMGSALALFASSARALGRNWSLTARTRMDHELVRTGPYARVRHPIYLGMLFFLLSMAIAFGHWLQLVGAIPLFLVGTAIRTRIEDRLLEENFGEEFIAYRRTTPALIPKLSG